jgi:hypothetical protein
MVADIPTKGLNGPKYKGFCQWARHEATRLRKGVEYIMLIPIIIMAMLSPPSGSVMYLWMFPSGCRSQ